LAATGAFLAGIPGDVGAERRWAISRFQALSYLQYPAVKVIPRWGA
jgi:hypothetical protein